MTLVPFPIWNWSGWHWASNAIVALPLEVLFIPGVKVPPGTGLSVRE